MGLGQCYYLHRVSDNVADVRQTMGTMHLGEATGGEGGTVAVRCRTGVVLPMGPVEGHHGLGGEQEGPVSSVEGIRPTGPILSVYWGEPVTVDHGICTEYE